MTKILKITSLVGVGLVFSMLVILLVLTYLIRVGEFRSFIIREVEGRTQMKARMGEMDLQLGKVIGISIRDFALREKDDTPPVIKARRVLIRVALLSLLERRIAFDEIRLYHPEIQIGRGPGGKIPLLELMTPLPSRKTEEDRFTFDVHKVRIEGGEVLFRNQREGRGPNITHLRRMDLNIRRIKGEDISGIESQLNVPALEYSLRATIERAGQRAGLASTGKILFPKGAFHLRQAWLDAHVDVRGLPVGLLRDLYGFPLPVKGASGILTSRLRWRGNLVEGARIKGEVKFQHLEVDAPEIFASVVVPGDGQLELKMEISSRQILLRRLDLRSNEISLSVQGSMRSLAAEDPTLEVHLTTPFLPLLVLRKYLPRGVLYSSPWGDLFRSVKEGEMRLTKAGVSGRLSEVRRVFQPGFEDLLWFDAEVRGVGGDLPGKRFLPVRGISGRFVLEKGVLYYKNVKGSYGRSLLEEIEGRQTGVISGQRLLEIRVRGQVHLGQMWEQSKLDILPKRLAQVASGVQDVSGKGKVEVFLRTDFESLREYNGTVSMENASVRVDDVLFSEIRGELSFSPTEISAEGVTALLAGSPVRVGVVLRNYLSDGSRFDLTVDSPGVKAGVVSRILLSIGSPEDPGTIRGRLRYRGSFVSSGTGKLTGSLELIGVQIPPRFWSRPLQAVSGKLKLDESGVDLQGFQGQIGGYGFDFSGKWWYRERPQLTFTLRASEMDLDQLLPQGDAGIDDWSDRLQAKGTISIDKGRYERFEFSDLKTVLTLDEGRWFFDGFSARSLGGTVQGEGSFIDSPEGLSFSVNPKIREVPVKGLLGWFDIGTKGITGKVNLTGTFESRGKTASMRKKNLNGAFELRIADGVVKRFRLLVRILSLLDLSRWFSLKMPDINQEGIRLRRVSADFKVSQGVYSTQNLVVDGDELRITGAGQLDGPKGDLNFVIAVRPFPKVDSAVNFIPLIGQGLAGVKNSLLVASFRIKGPVDNPTITPAPLSTLSEFFYGALAIPRDLIGARREEKK
ncbi:MAG: AsmA-like C-terminal domain-containing protein [Candidatus Binatia bacterium]